MKCLIDFFSTTWSSFSNFTCHTVKAYPTITCANCEPKLVPENLTDCEVVVDPEDDKVTCDSPVRLNGIVHSCLGKKCCRKRQIWSKYRNRCVRNFKRY